MNKTKIAWADYSWNVVTGCTPVSEGCAHCYCRAMEKRFRWPMEVTLREDRLNEPARVEKPSRVFPCSMSDLFHPEVPFAFIAEVWKSMWRAPQHTFLILTKRVDRLADFIRWFYDRENPLRNPRLYDHIWLGVTAENQQRADERIPILLQIPAAKRWVSVEPMLGPVALGDYLPGGEIASPCYGRGLDWVVAGCESGPGRRPAQQDWFREIRDQCVEQGVSFFLKQAQVEGKVAHMPELDGRVWAQIPGEETA